MPVRALPRPAVALLAAAFVLAGASAQQDRWQEAVDRAIRLLDDPDHRLDALRQLEHFGPRLVPIARQRLHWQHRARSSQQVQLDLIYVLGRFGRDSLPALPELLDVLRGPDLPPALGVLETLAALAPFFDDQQNRAVRGTVDSAYSDLRRHPLVSELYAQLWLGAAPERAGLLSALKAWGNPTHAACRWLIAHADEPLADRDDLLAAIDAQRGRAMQRREVDFDRGDHFPAAALAEAWLALTGQPPDASAARGLLSHRLPEQRQRGIAWLADHGASLPRPERADLAVRLWDGDARVVVAAARALAGWGPRGLVGLAPLRQFGANHADADVRDACRIAGDAIVATFAEVAGADAELVRALDRALQGIGGPRPGAMTATGSDYAADVLHLAQWHEPTKLVAVLALLDGKDPGPVVGKVYSWLRTDQPMLAQHALAWLARHGAATRAAMLECTRDAYGEAARLAAFWVAEFARPTAIEATAWFLTADAARKDLVDLLGSTNTRWLARSLAALLARPGADLAAVAPRLRELVALRADAPLEHADADYRMSTQPLFLAEPVRVLAAIALAELGETPADEAGLDDLVRRHCGVTLAGLGTFVGAERRAGRLPELLDRIEVDCRRLLGVPEQLGWPANAAR